MITIGICDDEPAMRKSLRLPLERTLQLMGYEYRIVEYDSGEALVSKIGATQLDLLFLDIEMKELSGMETAKLLRKQDNHMILVFVTAYPDYVFQGYEVHAFHYILKPYQEQKIIDVVKQALAELDSQTEQYYILEQKSGIRRIPFKSILAFRSDRRKISILTTETEYEFYGKLTDVVPELPNYFIRIHNRYLANLNAVTSLEKDTCICGNEVLPVSRTYKQDLEIAFARSLLK